MKKALLFTLLLLFISSPAFAWRALRDLDAGVPKVRYTSPKDDSKVEITDIEDVKFKWKRTPIPIGGRHYYRFQLFYGFQGTPIIDKRVSRHTSWIKIPPDTFEDGQLYSWQVQQRDDKSGTWSYPVRWSFRARRAAQVTTPEQIE